jgi:hypothetical protein
VIALGSTVGYVGLLAHYQRRAAERSAKIIYLQSIRPATEDARGLVSSQTTSQENEDRGRERSTRSSRFESADESADRDSHYSGQYRDQYDTAGDEVWYAETGVWDLFSSQGERRLGPEEENGLSWVASVPCIVDESLRGWRVEGHLGV